MHISGSDCRRRSTDGIPLLAVVTLAITAGCELAPVRPAEADTACAAPAAAALVYARQLSAADPPARTRAHQQALAEYRQNPGQQTRVRLALAGSFLEPLPDETTQTRALFRELLQGTPPLPAALEALLEMRLNEMDARLEAQKLTARQQAELEAAEAKIEALTTIEKTSGGMRGR